VNTFKSLTTLALAVIPTHLALAQWITGIEAAKRVQMFLKSQDEAQWVTFPRLNADHASYTGKVIAVQARANTSDSFSGPFDDKQADFYCLCLSAADEGVYGPNLYAYAPKKLWKGLIDVVVKAEEAGKRDVQVEAALIVLAEGSYWEHVLLLDVRPRDTDGKRGDWILRSAVAKAAKDAADAEAAKRAEKVAKAESAKPRPRTWTDPETGKKFVGSFRGKVGGKVRVVGTDGELRTLEYDRLHPDDMEYITSRTKGSR
jgi:hypothetical protein